MSRYTTELRFICCSLAGREDSGGYNDVNEIISLARPKIFDFDYPIFDPAYKEVLETKIIKHYYTREIGAEVYGLWKMYLNTRMNEIMPLYNKWYKSELLDFNPMHDTDLTRQRSGEVTANKDDSGTQTGSGTNESSTSSTGTGWDLYSDTPQGSIENLDQNAYLTNARKTTDNSTGSSNGSFSTNQTVTNNSNAKTTEAYLETIKGKQGGVSYSKLLKEYRETFVNIDQRVINELDDLFMRLW